MWNSGKKIRALHDKKKYILTLVLSEKKILNETKNHNPGVSKWAGTRYFYPPEIVYSTGRNY